MTHNPKPLVRIRRVKGEHTEGRGGGKRIFVGEKYEILARLPQLVISEHVLVGLNSIVRKCTKYTRA